jgi:hypothetical protein
MASPVHMFLRSLTPRPSRVGVIWNFSGIFDGANW